MSKRPQSQQNLLTCARKERGWTQAYVAEQVNVVVDTVRQWEGGRHLPYQATIQKLCLLFQMTPESLGLLKEQDNPLPHSEEKVLLFAGETNNDDNPEQLTLKKANTATISNEVVRPTMSNDLFLFQNMQGTREPNEEEKKAAWELHVELVTRIPIAPLGHDEGILREALSSLYSLFQTTRTILRSHGPTLAPDTTDKHRSCSYVIVCMLNTTVRPLLAKWHPLLKTYEEMRPTSIGVTQYEQQWERYTELRQEIILVRKDLIAYAQVFAQIAGVSSLIIDTSEVTQ